MAVARLVATGVVARTVGVRLGVDVAVGGWGVVPGTGMTRTWPGRMIFVFVMPFASARASTLTP